MKKLQALLVMMGENDLKRLKDFPDSKNYIFHHLPRNPVVTGTATVDMDNFDVFSYIDAAVEYVKNNHIDIVIGMYDIATFVAGIIREKTGLPGPGIETSFKCFHKYYTHLNAEQDSKLWYSVVDLDKIGDNKSQISYPVYLKSPVNDSGGGQAKAENEYKMYQALCKIKQFTDHRMDFYKALFERFLDVKKFPLSIRNVVLVEEYVDNGKMMVCEGWADKHGIYHLWQHVDGLDFLELNDARYIPSTTPIDVLKDVELFLQDLCTKFNLRSVFFNTDIWIIQDEVTNHVIIGLIEINKRLSVNLHDLYQFRFKKSSFEAALLVAIDASSSVQPPICMPGDGFTGVFAFNIQSADKCFREKIAEQEKNDQNLKIVLHDEIEVDVRSIGVTSGHYIAGHLFVSSDSLEGLKTKAHQIYKRIFTKEKHTILV